MLSKAGIGSRTDGVRLMKERRVTVNGRAVTDPETWVDPRKDKVAVDGRPLSTPKPVHLLLYKPKGYLTSYGDTDGRKTVYDLMPPGTPWIFPVGRLDLDTTGLLLMTNDATLAERLTNPEHEVPKTYLLKASRLITDEEIARLRSGIELKDGPTRPARVHRVKDTGGRTTLEMTITEGRNRQVRRMIEALDAKVLKLVRIAIGRVRIGELPIGSTRPLTAEEICELSGMPRGKRR
ncbi:MAG TPA: pseudouridine synthase [Candidatus Polarisedimenticolaceae bacterium]|nr:pseudouridine synthase [Candidatus Polarisedimenticolaceae bacterium]